MRKPEQTQCQLEKELAFLSNTRFQDTETVASVKQRVRTIKNRLSAKKSRDQARQYVEQLESSVSSLARRSEMLSRRLAQVEGENRKLRAETSKEPSPEQAGVPAPCQNEDREKVNVSEPAVGGFSSLPQSGDSGVRPALRLCKFNAGACHRRRQVSAEGPMARPPPQNSELVPLRTEPMDLGSLGLQDVDEGRSSLACAAESAPSAAMSTTKSMGKRGGESAPLPNCSQEHEEGGGSYRGFGGGSFDQVGHTTCTSALRIQPPRRGEREEEDDIRSIMHDVPSSPLEESWLLH